MLKRILKILGWIGLIALVGLTTVVLVAIGRGYSYDFGTGRLKLNGLVIFSSTPGGANIMVNGRLIHHKTPYRSTLEAGDYIFEISKPGYQTWSKRISIEPSQVSWAQYILLIAQKPVLETWLSAPAGLSLLSTSRDHRHFAYVNGEDGSLWTFDNNNHKPTKVYAPVAPADGQPVEVISGLAWADDASRILITSQSGDKTYERLIDANGSNLKKLTEQYGFDLGILRFSPTNASQLFWLSADGLRRIDTDSQTVSAVLAPSVSAYTFGGSGQIIYIQPTQLGNAVFAMDTGGQNKHQLIQSVVASPSYQLVYASYRSKDMLAILPSGSRTITFYSQVTTDHPVATVLTKSADSLVFNSDGRFLNYRDGQRLSTYDLELNRTYNFGNSKTPYQYLGWFDTYHLLVANGTTLSLMEFDGANEVKLSSNFVPGLISFTSNQHEVLAGVATANSKAIKLEAITIKP